jgi:hypothetical protein
MRDHSRPSRPPRESWAGKQFRCVNDPFSLRLVNGIAVRLSRKPLFCRSDFDDIVQELLIKLCASESSYDPAKSRWEQFVTAVVERHALTLINRARAQKRCGLRTVSLNEEIAGSDGGPTELIHAVSQADQDRRLGRETLSDEEHTIHRLDVDSVVESSRPEDRAWLRRVMEDAIRAVGREQSIPESTLRCRCKAMRRRLPGY